LSVQGEGVPIVGAAAQITALFHQTIHQRGLIAGMRRLRRILGTGWLGN